MLDLTVYYRKPWEGSDDATEDDVTIDSSTVFKDNADSEREAFVDCEITDNDDVATAENM